MDFPKLYRDKRIWYISTDGTNITRSYGIEGGKLQVKVSKGNEHIAHKLWQSQRMKGYSQREEVSFVPQQNHLYTMFKHKLPLKVYIQPEYDGIPVYIEYTDARDVKIKTHDGAIISGGFKKTREYFKEILQCQDLIVVGEFRSGDVDFDELCSKFHDGDDALLEFHATDCFLKTKPECKFRERRILLSLLMSGSYIEFNGIGMTDGRLIDKRDIQEKFDYCALDGQEGFVIYDPEGTYTMGKKNRGYLKLKHPKHREYKITSRSKTEWICETPRGVKFAVSPINDNNHSIVNIKFKDYTVDGVPKAPVCVSTRNQ